MKRRKPGFLLVVLAVSSILNGCQEAPEATEEDGILYVKSDAENQVQDILEEESVGTETEEPPGGQVDCLVGTEENGIKISAKLPALPTKAYEITLTTNEKLDKDMLTAFLDSDSGNIQDKTEEYLVGIAEELNNQSEEEIALVSTMRDDSTLVLTDGEKEAGFYGHTTVKYEDTKLSQGCHNIYKSGTETEIFYCGSREREDRGELEFSSVDAEKLLMKKLEVIGIAEIHMERIILYESDDFMFYELYFTPSYEGIGVAHEFGSVSYGEVFPNGVAWVTEDGVATLSGEEFCLEASEKSEQTSLLKFSQIKRILEVYLNNNTICGSSKIVMSNIEFLYYPVFSEEDKTLKLVPVWNISIPLRDLVENSVYTEECNEKNAAWNIYINAVTGKIEKVE